MGNYRIISSDNHVFEPPDLWTSRIEAQYKDRCPQIKPFNGGQIWVCDDRKGQPVASGTNLGKRFENPEDLKPLDVFENVRPGGYIPEEHVKDMDADGVDVSIVYPSVGLLLYGTVRDSQLLTAVFKTYNDFVSEFCGAVPGRICGIAMINIDDVQVGVKELERTRKLGFVGAMITVYPPQGRSYDSPEYDPLWTAAQDLEIPLSFHAATNRAGSGEGFQGAETLRTAYLVNMDHWVRMSLADMILSGVFERFPRLQVGAVEHELSWVPHFLNRLDYNYRERARGQAGYRFKNAELPSDVFRRNVFLGFQEDAIGIRDRHTLGVDTLQWGADYPHAESTFPRSREILDQILADCNEEEKAKIVGGNAARVYKI